MARLTWIKRRARKLLRMADMLPACADTRRVAVAAAAEDWTWLQGAPS